MPIEIQRRPRILRSGILAASVLATVVCTRPAGAETWIVAEGDKGAIHGVWQVSIDGRRFTGSAAMTSARGQPLSYNLGGEFRDGRLVASRIGPSDRTPCTYMVEIGRSRHLAGSARCDGSTSPWQVTRTGNR